MPGPRPSDVPRIRLALRVYRISAIVTGVFLLLLCLLMVFRYGFHQDVELGGPFGFLALQQKELIVGVNLSTAILIVHGWLYVVYLGLDFALWRLLRFSFARFLFIALGGVVPLLSFFFEFRVPKWVNAEVDAVEAPNATVAA
jgi:integral membrane protein